MSAPGRWSDATRWAVWGAGQSGLAAANLLAGANKRVTLWDERSAEALASSLGGLDPSVRVRAGRLEAEDAEIVVLSPGIKPSHAALGALFIPAIPEIELAWDHTAAPMACVTGTDGKTTTTSLLAAIYAEADRPHRVGGNIGTPLCEIVDGLEPGATIVAEISAFQLWSARHFRPYTAALTNLAPDHLDYFDGDDRAYAEAKRALIARAGAGVPLVYGAESAEGARWAKLHDGSTALFSSETRPVGAQRAVWREGRSLLASWEGEDAVVVDDLGALPIAGDHNARNVACAAALAIFDGIEAAACGRAALGFRGLPHRFEPIGVFGGVRYIDDSKATNFHAALAGLRGGLPATGRVAVIAGGVDKGLAAEEFAHFLRARADFVALIGQIAPRLAALIGEQARIFATLEEAVALAHEAVGEGGTVVLSPGCSSFDMFESYAARGERFGELARALDSRGLE